MTGTSYSARSRTAKGAVTVHPFWLPVGGEAAACWLHLPTSGPLRSSGVLICPPWGFEYTHSHRTVLRLANQLAERGFATLRLDYPGTGTSTGDAHTPGQPELWSEALVQGADRLQELTGKSVSVVGLRLGAMLAGKLSSERSIDHLVLWNPVVRGKRFIREQEAVRKLAGLDPRAADEILEAGGFQLSPETVDTISSMSLLDELSVIDGEAMLVERDDLEPDERLSSHLESIGVPTTLTRHAGYLDMIAEPQYTVIPDSTISEIADWLAARTPTGPELPDPVDLPWLQAPRNDVEQGVSEEMVWIGSGGRVRLFGVLSLPSSSPPKRSVTLLLNAGTVHHVGPNRIYVELARALAANGVPNLRVDIRNLGESVRVRAPEENHPYPSSAVDDVRIALDWLASEHAFDSYVLAGLCSGAYTSFRAAIELTEYPITAIVPINPLTFQWHDGMTLDTPDTYKTAREARYYSKAVLSLDSWVRMLKGRSNVRYILGFLARQAGSLIGRGARGVLGALGLSRLTRLATELRGLEERGCRVDFVFSDGDPGFDILRGEAGRTVDALTRDGALRLETIPGADHTFSRKAERDVAVATVVDWYSDQTAP